jgi:hypothetical protein
MGGHRVKLPVFHNLLDPDEGNGVPKMMGIGLSQDKANSNVSHGR